MNTLQIEISDDLYNDLNDISKESHLSIENLIVLFTISKVEDIKEEKQWI